MSEIDYKKNYRESKVYREEKRLRKISTLIPSFIIFSFQANLIMTLTLVQSFPVIAAAVVVVKVMMILETPTLTLFMPRTMTSLVVILRFPQTKKTICRSNREEEQEEEEEMEQVRETEKRLKELVIMKV